MSLPSFRKPFAALVALLPALAGACRDAPVTGTEAVVQADVTVTLALAGTSVTALALVVTGPGIATPLVTSVDATNAATVTTTIDVPVGGQRTIVARGFDADGMLTHEGMTTVAIRPSGNPPVAVRLYPRIADVPIVIGTGTYGVLITPSPLLDMTVGETQQLSARVTDAEGGVVTGATVKWGSLNPAVAQVSAEGLITARVAGTTTLYASYRGSAASVDLTVFGPPLVLREIVAGPGFTCALDDEGAAWCWGINDQGQLGDGTDVPSRTRPAPVAGGLRFTTLSAGVWHTCGITTVGEAWCWGWSDEGEFGAPPEGSVVRTPRRVVAPHVWASIDVGRHATCAITVGGEAWCWGWGIPGNIGTSGPYSIPIRGLSRVTAATGPFASISVERASSCIVRTSGEAFCSWDESSVNFVTPASVAGFSWRKVLVSSEYLDPTQPGHVVRTVPPVACGLTTTKDVRCWGNTIMGIVSSPALLGGVAAVQDWDDLAVGRTSACALRGGAAFCWGGNDRGQLGDASTITWPEPVPVVGGHVYTRIAVGAAHACGLRADGAAFCWGQNGWGELGDGTQTLRRAPTPVAKPLPTP